jgi:hypothetical protein
LNNSSPEHAPNPEADNGVNKERDITLQALEILEEELLDLAASTLKEDSSPPSSTPGHITAGVPQQENIPPSSPGTEHAPRQSES